MTVEMNIFADTESQVEDKAGGVVRLSAAGESTFVGLNEVSLHVGYQVDIIAEHVSAA